jgi:hypothetical protein
VKVDGSLSVPLYAIRDEQNPAIFCQSFFGAFIVSTSVGLGGKPGQSERRLVMGPRTVLVSAAMLLAVIPDAASRAQSTTKSTCAGLTVQQCETQFVERLQAADKEIDLLSQVVLNLSASARPAAPANTKGADVTQTAPSEPPIAQSQLAKLGDCAKKGLTNTTAQAGNRVLGALTDVVGGTKGGQQGAQAAAPCGGIPIPDPKPATPATGATKEKS